MKPLISAQASHLQAAQIQLAVMPVASTRGLSRQSQLPADTSVQRRTSELWPQGLLTRKPRSDMVNRTQRNTFLQAALVDLLPSYNGLALPVSVSTHPEPAMVLYWLHFPGFSRHTSASGRWPVLLGSQPSPLFPLPFEQTSLFTSSKL